MEWREEGAAPAGSEEVLEEWREEGAAPAGSEEGVVPAEWREKMLQQGLGKELEQQSWREKMLQQGQREEMGKIGARACWFAQCFTAKIW